MAAYRRVDDLRLPVGWLLVHRDQLWAQRAVSSMGSLYLFYLYMARQTGLVQFLTTSTFPVPTYTVGLRRQGLVRLVGSVE